jgi:hypothetical protein
VASVTYGHVVSCSNLELISPRLAIRAATRKYGISALVILSISENASWDQYVLMTKSRTTFGQPAATGNLFFFFVAKTLGIASAPPPTRRDGPRCCGCAFNADHWNVARALLGDDLECEMLLGSDAPARHRLSRTNCSASKSTWYLIAVAS